MATSTPVLNNNDNTSDSIASSPIDVVDIARKYPKDDFIDRLLSYAANDETFLNKIRTDLFESAKSRNECPLGELKTCRRRKIGEPLDQKLANDCHTICMFLLGGTTDELQEIISNSNKSSVSYDVCTPRRLPCLPSSVTSSPIRICTNSYDDIANIRAEILMLKSIQSDNNTEMSNEIKRLNSEINRMNILKDKCEKSEQQISDLEKRYSKLSELFNKHVKSIIKTQKDTDESVKKLISSVDAVKEKHACFEKKTNSSLLLTESDVQTINVDVENILDKTKKLSSDNHSMKLTIADMVRQINNINEPDNSAISSIKGEVKIIRQQCKTLSDELKSLDENVLSNKNSITNLRKTIASTDQQLNTLKRAKHLNTTTECSHGNITYSAAVQTKSNAQPKDHRVPSPTNDPKNNTAQRRSSTDESTYITPTSQSTRPPQRNATADHRPIPVRIHPRKDTTDRALDNSAFNVIKSKKSSRSSPNQSEDSLITANKQHTHCAHYYVGNINSSVSLDIFKSYITRRNIDVIDVRLFNSKTTHLKCAKLSVSFDHSPSIEDAYFWPPGVYARQWHG